MNVAISSSPFFLVPIISLAVETGTSIPFDTDSKLVSLSGGMNFSVRTVMTVIHHFHHFGFLMVINLCTCVIETCG